MLRCGLAQVAVFGADAKDPLQTNSSFNISYVVPVI
jgi:hypothetical protein